MYASWCTFIPILLYVKGLNFLHMLSSSSLDQFLYVLYCVSISWLGIDFLRKMILTSERHILLLWLLAKPRNWEAYLSSFYADERWHVSRDSRIKYCELHGIGFD